MTYLLARPMLRKALGETEPTTFETNLLEGLRTRQANDQSMFPGLQKEPLKSQARNVEAALAVLLLGPSNKPAWDHSPSNEGGFKLNLDPWESEGSEYSTATMVAIGAARAGEKAPSLTKYLKREFPNQPLHHKVMALWAGVLDKPMRDSLLDDIWKLQAPDGGWTDEALGPWQARPAKPDTQGASSAYATALITFALQQAGAGCSDPRSERARKWLKAHQSAETGAWSSPSMNKKFPEGSMQIRFMDDAATGFAVMALLDQGRCAGPQM